MTFEVTAMDKAGGRRTFRRDAESSSALSAQLRSEGFVVVSVEEVAQMPVACCYNLHKKIQVKQIVQS